MGWAKSKPGYYIQSNSLQKGQWVRGSSNLLLVTTLTPWWYIIEMSCWLLWMQVPLENTVIFILDFKELEIPHHILLRILALCYSCRGPSGHFHGFKLSLMTFHGHIIFFVMALKWHREHILHNCSAEYFCAIRYLLALFPKKQVAHSWGRGEKNRLTVNGRARGLKEEPSLCIQVTDLTLEQQCKKPNC